jgi:hypothetical protein
MRSSHRRQALHAAGILALSLLAAPPALATAPCPTFFPDFRCDRSGRYEGFVAPLAGPFLFEDPFITTGVSAWGLWHEFPNDSVFGGGDLWGAAVQARIAITDRLALIATKDGYVFLDPGNTAVFRESDGFLNITGGLKYALIDMPEENFILSPSLRFEAPVGNDEVFSGYGDGQVIPALSTAWGIGDLHAIADLGWQVPFDGDKQSTSMFYHLHLDYALLRFFVPLAELSGYHWIDGGHGSIKATNTKLGFDPTLDVAQAALMTGRFEGADVLNLGSRGVGGNDLVTLAFGARIPIGRHVSLGAIYEFPITNREDIFDERVTMNLLLEY